MDQVRSRRAETRTRIVHAATGLFVERGYLAATMSGIAAAAGVSVQTLYLSFDGKAAILEAALAAVAEDHPDGWRAQPDGPAALAAYLGPSALATERRYPLDAVLLAAAADPEPAELLADTRAAVLARHGAVVDELAERPGFTHAISLQRATEVVATLVAPQTYGLLVQQYGWTTPEWVEWAVRHATADLFPD